MPKTRQLANPLTGCRIKIPLSIGECATSISTCAVAQADIQIKHGTLATSNTKVTDISRLVIMETGSICNNVLLTTGKEWHNYIAIQAVSKKGKLLKPVLKLDIKDAKALAVALRRVYNEAEDGK